MPIEYKVIKPKFEQLRHFFMTDLNLLVKQNYGGNYITAFLIACACETLSYLRDGKSNRGERILSEMMLPDKWRPVAKSLYDAMRNGIAHRYETKTIKIEGKELEISISWKQKPHLTFSEDRSCLYLNIQAMAKDLKKAFKKYENELKGSLQRREEFYKWINRKWEPRIDRNELSAWKSLLNR